jgi:putative solute:sodium symporter small subunit
LELTEKHKEYWRKTVTITIVLLTIWAIVTYVIGFLARDLAFNFFGWPFSFWVGAQGAPLTYVILIGFYAWYMNRLDKEYGVSEGDDE